MLSVSYRDWSIYIENIIDISPISVSVSYRHFRYRCFRYIDIVWVTTEILVIFGYFIVLFSNFTVNLKTDNYMSEIEYLIWQCDMSLHLVTSLLVRN